MNVNSNVVDTLLPSINKDMKESELHDFRTLALEADLTVYSFQEEVGMTFLLGKKVSNPFESSAELLFIGNMVFTY